MSDFGNSAQNFFQAFGIAVGSYKSEIMME
jgi:hypothetical protein